MCSVHLCSRATNRTIIFHSPSCMRQHFSHSVVRNLNLTASSRFMSSTTPSVSKCPLQHLHQSSRSRPQASLVSIRPSAPSSQSRPHAITSLQARRHGNPSFPSSALFLVAASCESMSTSVAPSSTGAVLLRQSQDQVFSLRIDVLGSVGSTLHFRCSSQCLVLAVLVPADDDPPDRSVSPASAVVGASSVTCGGPTRRTKSCPSHCNPFKCCSKETSVGWSGGILRTVRAICRLVSVTMMCALSSSSRPPQKPLSQPLSPL